LRAAGPPRGRGPRRACGRRAPRRPGAPPRAARREGLLTSCTSPRSLSPPARAPADVATAEAAGPADAVDGGVGARLRLLHRGAERAHVEHAPAVAHDASALRTRAGVEDFYVLDFCRVLQSFDDRAFREI